MCQLTFEMGSKLYRPLLSSSLFNRPWDSKILNTRPLTVQSDGAPDTSNSLTHNQITGPTFPRLSPEALRVLVGYKVVGLLGGVPVVDVGGVHPAERHVVKEPLVVVDLDDLGAGRVGVVVHVLYVDVQVSERRLGRGAAVCHAH